MNTYITTPIFYVNAQPHLGHAYTTIVADAYSRYKRLCGNDVRFQTGTDEHGEKIVQAAQDAGVSPKEYVDKISTLFREAWPVLTIKPDNFIRTTDSSHVRTVQDILQKVYDRGDIYFDEYTGLYCKGCERFLTEKELVDDKCPDHLTVPEEICEQNYFFRMGNYQQWLIDHIQNNPEFITPERYRNEVLSFLKEPLEDLCISRPTSRLTWGIPFPFDDRFVTYVWFDALINYLTGIGYPDGAEFEKYWQVAEHVIAKDILKPHAIYWPTMLKAMGLEPYAKLHVHGYWKIGETKMSKSLGNVVRPVEMAASFGVDAVRYFLLRDMSFGLDSGYTPEAVVARQNADLANDLGNLFSRSLTMVKKFAGGKVPEPGDPQGIDSQLADAAREMVAAYQREMDDFSFHKAIQAIWDLVGRANKYIVVTAPWELAKDPKNSDRLNTVFYHLLESLRLIAVVVQPIMPDTAEKMFDALGLDREGTLEELAQWGKLQPGMEVKRPASLFPRLDLEELKKQSEKAVASSPEKTEESEDSELISFDDFKKLDLRVGEIVAAEKVKKSDRLLKLTVKAPEERTIVAGVAEHYQPEDVVGKQVIIVANLKPVKLMGVLSHGLVLAARDGDRLMLSGVSEIVAPGSRVS
ncbi:MAG: methionine--tRNA ligase [Desulfobulbaceae bacterium]|uniref:Methionine--tRNA ligase n=1 Tax=Candidatus Desulfobia pelagia TaxID=2841692 RepID=A0A8J6ND96_9BACT|nr:methionine--tRNA ligase [Candidatus Desulfobia pelagia]